MSTLYYESSISHHGIKGQKWGVRRYQDTNGRLTRLGRKRYSERDAALDKYTNKRRDGGRYVNEEGDKISNKAISDFEKNPSIVNSPERKALDKACDQYRKAYTPVLEFKKNRELVTKYMHKASDEEMRAWERSNRELTSEEKAGWYDWFKSSGDPTTSAFKIYCRESGIDYKPIAKEMRKAYTNLDDASRSYSKVLMDAYSDTPMSEIKDDFYVIQDVWIKITRRTLGELRAQGYDDVVEEYYLDD